MLILLGVGWVLSYIGWLDAGSKNFLNKFIIKICVPCVTITNFFQSFPREMLSSSGIYVLAPLMNMFILFMVSQLIYKILKNEPHRLGSFAAMCAVSNCNLFGLPISISLFGEESLPFVFYFYIANSIIFWGLCNPMMMKDKKNLEISFFNSIKKVFSIPFVTVIVCVALLWLNFTPPTFVLNLTKYFANLVTPLAFILVGRIMYEIDFKDFKVDLSVFLITVMRFVIAPGLMIIFSKLFNISEMGTQVYIILSAMPVMIQTTLISELYGTDSRYSATALSATTILSLAFIPIYMLIMPMLF